MAATSVKKLVGWKGGFQLTSKKRGCRPALCQQQQVAFNRIYLALSVLMKDRVAAASTLLSPEMINPGLLNTPSVDHIEEHTALVACMREAAA